MSESLFESTFDSRLFNEFYGVQPQAITWMKPIFAADGKTITDFEYIYSNAEGLRYLGLTPEQHNGLRLSNSPTLNDALREAVMEEIKTVYLTGTPSRKDVYNPILKKYARALRTRLRDGVLTVIQDRTAEIATIRQLEESTRELQDKSKQLEDQKALLDNILKNSSNGISVSRVFRDENGKVVDALTILANDAAVRYIGFPREIYLSKRATEIEPAVIGSPYYQACIKTLDTGEPFVMQYQMQSNGRWLELTVSKLDNDHLIQVFTDVTPIKEAQLKLEQFVVDLRRSNESLEDFTSAASHDLKEPIRKVQFFTERLRAKLQSKLDEEEDRLLQRVENASMRMKMLIDDLLEYSHVSRSDQQLEEIELNAKLAIVLADLDLMISEKNAEIIVHELPQILGYRRQLQQLFQNLIGNSLKYSKADAAPVIEINSSIVKGSDFNDLVKEEDFDKQFHLITVKDNGIGFEQQYAERIFNIFTRLHGNQEYRGTGVGLAIVKKVVENHQGYVTARSLPGLGATFYILLPAYTLVNQ